jgi:hypothetical protein
MTANRRKSLLLRKARTKTQKYHVSGMLPSPIGPMLSGVSTSEPLTFPAIALLLSLEAAVACLLPTVASPWWVATLYGIRERRGAWSGRLAPGDDRM